MSDAVLWGCPNCNAIFDEPEFRYLENEVEEYWFCQNCGHPAVELGVEPKVTQPSDGLYYLTDEVNMMGPYQSEESANADLWSWFGGKDAYETSQERQRRRLQDEEDDYDEEDYPEGGQEGGEKDGTEVV